jgi:thymidylate kinase
MHQGIFISFEGIDGAGKSSHIQAVADAFSRHGHTVVQTREPGGTEIGEVLSVHGGTAFVLVRMDRLEEAEGAITVGEIAVALHRPSWLAATHGA